MSKIQTPREERMRCYESQWNQSVPHGSYVVIRVDGRAFHTFTRGMVRPFDAYFMGSMDRVAERLCSEIQGAQLAFVQSDEISVLVTAQGLRTQQWFGGNVNKMVSISAGIASSVMTRQYDERTAVFDSRVVVLPDRLEAISYFMWRQSDCFRNAIQSIAQEVVGHKNIHGKDRKAQVDMILAAGHRLENYPLGARQGRVITPHAELAMVKYIRKDTGAEEVTQFMRKSWKAEPAPWFDWDSAGFLESHIPTDSEDQS